MRIKNLLRNWWSKKKSLIVFYQAPIKNLTSQYKKLADCISLK